MKTHFDKSSKMIEFRPEDEEDQDFIRKLAESGLLCGFSKKPNINTEHFVHAEVSVNNTHNERREYRMLLDEIRLQLNRWADESISGSWSTHQVSPQRNLAARVQQTLDRY